MSSSESFVGIKKLFRSSWVLFFKFYFFNDLFVNIFHIYRNINQNKHSYSKKNNNFDHKRARLKTKKRRYGFNRIKPCPGISPVRYKSIFFENFNSLPFLLHSRSCMKYINLLNKLLKNKNSKNVW